MSVTCEVFHDPMSWLNAEAIENMPAMVVTCEVFHEPMSWLNAEAPRNMYPMSVTFEVLPRTDVLVEEKGICKH